MRFEIEEICEVIFGLGVYFKEDADGKILLNVVLVVLEYNMHLEGILFAIDGVL